MGSQTALDIEQKSRTLQLVGFAVVLCSLARPEFEGDAVGDVGFAM